MLGYLYRANLSGKNLCRADLHGAIMAEAQLDDTRLFEANMREAWFYNATFTGAHMAGSNMAFCSCSRDRPYSTGFSDEDVFYDVNTGSNRHRFSLTHSVGEPSCYFTGADLSYTNLRGSDLLLADFDGANLSYADLRHTGLAGARLRNTILFGADFRGAFLGHVSGGKLHYWAFLQGALYDKDTRWPTGFDPQLHGAILVVDPSLIELTWNDILFIRWYLEDEWKIASSNVINSLAEVGYERTHVMNAVAAITESDVETAAGIVAQALQYQRKWNRRRREILQERKDVRGPGYSSHRVYTPTPGLPRLPTDLLLPVVTNRPDSRTIGISIEAVEHELWKRTAKEFCQTLTNRAAMLSTAQEVWDGMKAPEAGNLQRLSDHEGRSMVEMAPEAGGDAREKEAAFAQWYRYMFGNFENEESDFDLHEIDWEETDRDEAD